MASHRTPSASRWRGALQARRVWSAPACRRFEQESGGEPPHSKRFALARRAAGAARLARLRVFLSAFFRFFATNLKKPNQCRTNSKLEREPWATDVRPC